MITCALLDIEHRECDRRPRGATSNLLSSTCDSISHRAQIYIEFICELHIESIVLDKRKQMILQCMTLYIERVH